jgi:hypothetical protein
MHLILFKEMRYSLFFFKKSLVFKILFKVRRHSCISIKERIYSFTNSFNKRIFAFSYLSRQGIYSFYACIKGGLFKVIMTWYLAFKLFNP